MVLFIQHNTGCRLGASPTNTFKLPLKNLQFQSEVIREEMNFHTKWPTAWCHKWLCNPLLSFFDSISFLNEKYDSLAAYALATTRPSATGPVKIITTTMHGLWIKIGLSYLYKDATAVHSLKFPCKSYLRLERFVRTTVKVTSGHHVLWSISLMI